MRSIDGGTAPGAAALWLVFGGASLAAVVAGCVAAGAAGVPARALILNLAAWAIGAGLALAIARVRRTAALAWLVLAAVGLVLTLFSEGLSGVHRWVGVGPVRLNAAALLLPLALAACAGFGPRSAWRLLFPVAAAVVLALQPDVSQAAALAGAAVVVLAAARRAPVARILAGIAIAAAVVVAWLRPDPLDPVPEVEGVVQLAAAVSPILAIVAMAALACAVLTPLVMARSPRPEARDAALALAAYFVLSALAPVAGAFPVPLVGMGLSPILGAWLGIGWLMNLSRPAPDAPG
jgi:cell division protein FtsW (lipid II flippase)